MATAHFAELELLDLAVASFRYFGEDDVAGAFVAGKAGAAPPDDVLLGPLADELV